MLVLHSASRFWGDSIRLKKAFYPHLCRLKLWELQILLRHTLWPFIVFGKRRWNRVLSLWADYKSKSKYSKRFGCYGKELLICKAKSNSSSICQSNDLQLHNTDITGAASVPKSYPVATCPVFWPSFKKWYTHFEAIKSLTRHKWIPHNLWLSTLPFQKCQQAISGKLSRGILLLWGTLHLYYQVNILQSTAYLLKTFT